MKTRTHLNSEKASVLVTVLLLVTILAAVAGSAFIYTTNRQRTIYQDTGWQEALQVAEAGLQAGVSQIQAQYTGTTTMSSGTYWFPVYGGSNGTTSFVNSNLTGMANYTVTQLAGSTTTSPYYRIRSQGTVPLRGSSSLSIDKEDATLRKISLGGTSSATQAVVSSNRSVSRTVETIIAPRTSDSYAVFSATNMTISGSMVIDSFNSSVATLSTGTVPYGQPGYTGQFSADQNPPIYDANLGTNGNNISVGSSTIYGSVSTNGGTVSGSGTVYGGVRTDAYQSLAPVGAPSWYTGTVTGIPVTQYNSKGKITGTNWVTNVNSTATITGGSQSSPSQYSINYAKLAGSTDTLTFAWQSSNNNGVNQTVANTNYIELYILGDLTTNGVGSGTGSIIIQPGVYVTLYIGGNVKLVGNSINNESGAAPFLQIYGVTPTTNTTPTWDFGGTTSFYGSVYAPSVALTGGGNATYVGSIVAGSVNFSGNMNFIYDSALAGKGKVLGWKQRSWFEDTGANGYTFMWQ